MTRARTRLVLTSAARRRVFGDYQPTEPSRFLEEIPQELIEQAPGTATAARAHCTSTTSSGPTRMDAGAAPAAAPGRAKTPRPRRSATRRKTSPRRRRSGPGARVRHAQFGLGTVISVEHLDDDARLVVRFSIGQKTLRAKFAKLEMA